MDKLLEMHSLPPFTLAPHHICRPLSCPLYTQRKNTRCTLLQIKRFYFSLLNLPSNGWLACGCHARNQATLRSLFVKHACKSPSRETCICNNCSYHHKWLLCCMSSQRKALSNPSPAVAWKTILHMHTGATWRFHQFWDERPQFAVVLSPGSNIYSVFCLLASQLSEG